MLGRLFLLALAVIVARQAFGRDAGITALAVVVFAFTAQLAIAPFVRPRTR
jgi:ABC-type methionine transport system permease subunit